MIYRTAFCFLLAAFSLIVYAACRARSSEERLLRSLVIAGTVAKVAGCLVVYLAWPHLNRYTDAANFYLPQTLDFLSGKVPYRDFASSYSIGFYALLALPVYLWRSVGAIALTMIAFEGAMILLYVRGDPEKRGIRWRAAFLYAFSPFSFYWVALTAHNAVLIAFFTMLALVLAERDRPLGAGVAIAVGYLATKLLAVLSWPAVVLFDPRHSRRAIVPIVALAAGLALMTALGANAFSSLFDEWGRSTTGNLWFLALRVFPGLRDTTAWRILPAVTWLAALSPFVARYVVRRGEDRVARFDAAAAMIAATGLLFLILSKKTYNYYIIMFLPFFLHTLIRQNSRVLLHLGAFFYLSATTYLEEVASGRLLTGLDLSYMVIYGCYLRVCWKALSGTPENARAGEGTTPDTRTRDRS